MNKLIKRQYKTDKLIQILPHGIFFWLRLLGFFTLFLLAAVAHVNFTNAAVILTTDDFVYIIQFNLFQFYFVSSSIINGNIFGNHLCIVLMIHNAIMSIFIPARTSLHLSSEYWIVSVLISASFLIEALMSIYLLYKRRYEINIDLFKKVGVNKKINDAFATRKFLESFGSLNIFVASVISGKVFLLPASLFKAFGGLIFGFTIITYIQQLYISVKFNDESLDQRKIAIFLSFIRIPVAIGCIVWRILTPINVGPYIRTSGILIYLLSDVLIIAIFMCIVLIYDTLQFGSGLKEALSFKTKKLTLI